MFFATAPTFAGDANGYTAQYECRAGNPMCDVDIATLTSQPCQETITVTDSAATINSKINGGRQYICIQPGDYTSKGAIAITASGSAQARRVLRYSESSTEMPWNQPFEKRVRLRKLVFDGADYWILDRLTFPASSDSTISDRIFIRNGASDLVLNRLLIEGAPAASPNSQYSAVGAWECAPGTADRVTLQNSVIRNNWAVAGSDPVGIAFECGHDVHIVNNEIYDWASHPVQLGQSNPDISGYVIENNDIYFTGDWHTNNGSTMLGENTIEIKGTATQNKIGRIIQNRIWGARWSDTARCCIGGTAGAGINLSASVDGSGNWVLVQNNVLMENQQGIIWATGYSTNASLIGNIIYKTKQYFSGANSYAIEFAKNNRSEIYLNSIIGADQYSIYLGADEADMRCNALILTGNKIGTNGGSSVVDNNVFLGSPRFTANGSDNNIDIALKMRQNSSAYSIGDMLVTGTIDQCTSATDSACFLYKVTQAGITSASPPAYCTSLGCRSTDGSLTVQAVRGPYVLYRKLLTSPQPYVIAYARAHSSTPDAYACPRDYSTLRRGIGVSDF